MRRANIIKRINWDNSDKGYMTVEASFIVPVLFFAFFLAILGLIFTYERGLILSNEYEGLYTVPLICEIGGTVDRLRRWRLYDDTFKE